MPQTLPTASAWSEESSTACTVRPTSRGHEITQTLAISGSVLVEHSTSANSSINHLATTCQTHFISQRGGSLPFALTHVDTSLPTALFLRTLEGSGQSWIRTSEGDSQR